MFMLGTICQSAQICKPHCAICLGLGLGLWLGSGLGQKFAHCACAISKLFGGFCILRRLTNRAQLCDASEFVVVLWHGRMMACSATRELRVDIVLLPVESFKVMSNK